MFEQWWIYLQNIYRGDQTFLKIIHKNNAKDMGQLQTIGYFAGRNKTKKKKKKQ